MMEDVISALSAKALDRGARRTSSTMPSNSTAAAAMSSFRTKHGECRNIISVRDTGEGILPASMAASYQLIPLLAWGRP
jgi:hypothetical protein